MRLTEFGDQGINRGGPIGTGRELLPVPGVGADDRLDVVVENGEPLAVPVQREPVVRGDRSTPFGGDGHPVLLPSRPIACGSRSCPPHPERGRTRPGRSGRSRPCCRTGTSSSSRSTGRPERAPAQPCAGAARAAAGRDRRSFLESSARETTVIALASALCVTPYTSAGSTEPTAASSTSMTWCIPLPWAFADDQRQMSARVRIRGAGLRRQVSSWRRRVCRSEL